MSKSDKNLATQNIMLRRLLVVTLVMPLLPLILEFFVLLPFVFFHLLTKESFWALSVLVSVTALAALALNIITAIILLLGGRKKITDESTKKLSNWIMGMSVVSVVALIVIAVVYLAPSHP